MKIQIVVAAFLLSPLNLMAANELPGDAAAGKKHHDGTTCLSCHSEMTSGNPDSLYTRSDRRVSDLARLNKQVAGCNKMQKVGLDEKQVNDVVKYLNESFYKFND